ncbi:hypothetical protein B0T19DRAFT_42977 [Cercophora scortea]|uniref:Tr-type G domain-containing protein n=1 Tax=Cercophora scortea TaxID=314031 RepID=A0AAE0J4S8_9PEZI|nr:hypothetical protein B0T19DRAFT_42977 [Cercophora scortea]
MSVFTFDPDPPRVGSPWLRSAESGEKPDSVEPSTRLRGTLGPGLLSDYGVTKLEAEPQEGPTEYKLHLLLRPRRKYERTSTAGRISGSTQSRPPPDPRSSKSSLVGVGSSTSNQARQDRLEHLTTQLLWRLQQSCPYHASSASCKLVVPQLHDLTTDGEIKVGKLLPGLEASKGALYEIGVADDGTFVGLTKDEMDESLTTLRVMAASLGCNLKVLRMVTVGDCEWIEFSSFKASQDAPAEGPRHRHAKLWVAEALITPHLRRKDGGQSSSAAKPLRLTEALLDPKQGPLTADQIRVTLTGPTTSGKSSLLGTLLTGILDNGHGISRLSLLKHRHEIASGITSSVAQELIGYSGDNIINYARSGIESWIDIHDFTKAGRLAYLVDSAGHPRFRRTTMRGVVGWAPHWTLLCIAADADSPESSSAVGGTSSALDVLGPAGAKVDLASAHLDLCLRLNLPLVIVITKLDLASTLSLSTTLNKILTKIKRAGRVPKILKGQSTGLGQVSPHDREAVMRVISHMTEKDDLLSVIPIVLASAVDGSGIGLLHAMLQSLPLPPKPTSHDYIGAALNPEQPSCLFHIEDRFSLPASYELVTSDDDHENDLGTVVAGHLRFGSLSIGDKVVVGPFPSEDDESPDPTPEDKQASGSYGFSMPHPSTAELDRIATRSVVSASAIKGEWHGATVVSIRNLRLPVQTLTAGQVGSIGIVLDIPKPEDPDGRIAPAPRIRKGQILAVPSQHMAATGLSLQAASGLTGVFEDDDLSVLTVGSLVNIYVASVRAIARILRVSRAKVPYDGGILAAEDDGALFSLSEGIDVNEVQLPPVTGTEVHMELLYSREWLELGSGIVILEGGRKDKSGLEGFVGKVVEIVE